MSFYGHKSVLFLETQGQKNSDKRPETEEKWGRRMRTVLFFCSCTAGASMRSKRVVLAAATSQKLQSSCAVCVEWMNLQCNISACINPDLFVCAFLWLILSLLTSPQDLLRSAQSAADVLMLRSEVQILHFIGNWTPLLVLRPLYVSFSPLLCWTVCYTRARMVSCQ